MNFLASLTEVDINEKLLWFLHLFCMHYCISSTVFGVRDQLHFYNIFDELVSMICGAGLSALRLSLTDWLMQFLRISKGFGACAILRLSDSQNPYGC